MNCECGLPVLARGLCRRHYNLQWRKDHPGKSSEYGKRWRAENTERSRKMVRSWAARNKDYLIKRSLEYDKLHREERRIKGAVYRAKNREWHVARVQAYQREHPEVRRTSSSNRRAREAQASGKHTTKEVMILFEKQSKACPICGELIVGKYHKDHIVPLSRGGSNNISNIQITHPTCNARKHTRLMAEL